MLLYQDHKGVPMIPLLEKALGDNAAMLRSERTGMDVMVLTPGAVSAEAMLGAVCLPVTQLFPKVQVPFMTLLIIYHSA